MVIIQTKIVIGKIFRKTYSSAYISDLIEMINKALRVSTMVAAVGSHCGK